MYEYLRSGRSLGEIERLQIVAVFKSTAGDFQLVVFAIHTAVFQHGCAVAFDGNRVIDLFFVCRELHRQGCVNRRFQSFLHGIDGCLLLNNFFFGSLACFDDGLCIHDGSIHLIKEGLCQIDGTFVFVLNRSAIGIAEAALVKGL